MGYTSQSPYIFGFATLEQLKFWIYKEEWVTQLEENGFVISRLEASSTEYVTHGRTQAIINRHTIKHQSHIPWEVLNHD